MSVLVKGMEMPEDGAYWCEIGVAGEIATITIHGEDRKSFRLVPVPPHGRLIDADELITKQEEDAEIFIESTNYGDKVRYDEAMNAVANIVNAPTVIPADKDSEI